LRKTFFRFHSLIRWAILLLLLILSLLVFIIESPATVLNLLKEPLKEQGITYGTIKGGLLSGFVLQDVTYKSDFKAKEVALKVDLEKLTDRVLVIDNLVLKDAQIDRTFLTSIIESNTTDENKSEEGNITLPFDLVIIKNADISIVNTGYESYYINSAKLHVQNLKSDMKTKHQGEVTFALDSNITKVNMALFIKDNNYDIDGNIEGERRFLNSFSEDYNLSFLGNPKLKLKANGNLKFVKYDLRVEALELKQNAYIVKSKKLNSFGSFNLEENLSINTLNAELSGNVAHLNLNAITTVDLDDINQTLQFDIESKVTPYRTFIPAQLSEQNITIKKIPTMQIMAKGDMNKVVFDTNIEGLKASQNGISLNLKKLKIDGSTKPLEGDLDTKIFSDFDSSLAKGRVDGSVKLNYKDINNTLNFDIKSLFHTHGKGLNLFLKDTNLSIIGESKIAINAKGDMKQVDFTTDVNNFRAKQNSIKLDVNKLSLKGFTQPIKGDTKVNLLTQFNSSLVDGRVDGGVRLNYKDINNTLKFNIKSSLNTNGEGLSKLLKDTNVTIQGKSHIKISAKGDMQQVNFSTYVNNFRGKQNRIKFDMNRLALTGYTQPLKGNSHVKLLSKFSSSIADGTFDGNASLNFKNIESSLKFGAKTDIKIHESYINPLLKDANVTLRGDSAIGLTAKGSLDRVVVQMNAKSKIFAENILSAVTLETTPITLNLKSHQVKGSLKLNSNAKNIALNLKSSFNGDYTKPKSIEAKNSLKLNSFNAFGINLSSFVPFNLQVDNDKNGAIINLDSKKLELHAKTTDYDNIVFKIKSEKIYPSTIMELPEELKGKFVKLKLDGNATISNMYLYLKGGVESNRRFKFFIDVRNREKGLYAKMYTKHLKIKAVGDIKKRDVSLLVKIDSITKLQEELQAIYPFEITPINGSIKLKAHLKGEEVFASIKSPKIKFEDFNIEKINIDAHYKDELITLNKFAFNTTKFSDSKLNKKFYLNKKGEIHLGKRKDISIDMHPNILVDVKGTEENLKGSFTLESLPLGHPKYGTVLLSSQINYEQIGKKKKIIGGISLEKLKLFYEAKFLDPAQDSDVVIITKKDKLNKKKSDNFLEDTYIDLAIYAPDAKYKTRDIDLMFTVDVKAKKEFGKNLGMLGKVRDINGRVEQAPKVFQVIDSNIVFRGTKEINPLLDILVQYELPDVLISINIHGDANRPKLDFSSEPQMPKKDILSYLLLGVSTAALSEGKGNLGREAELFIMNQAARDFAYEVELDRVLIKDDGTGEGYAVQVGKKIDDKTMFIIENSKEGNSFILEYEVNKNIKLEVGQHQKTIPSQSIDIFFRKRFR